MLVDNTLQDIPNSQVLTDITNYQLDKDTDYGYHKMTSQLHQIGYYINHKKVYRLMKEEDLLKDKHKKASKTYAKYRIVCPESPLSLIEMDIKQVWITENRSHAYILTIIDTFTRFVLHRTVGFSMKSVQVKKAWEYVIENYLQPADLLNSKINIEVRNDNGPQFIAKTVRDFFETNHLNQVFTHPYTPQENGHIESFHAILSNSLGKNPYWSLQELESKLDNFYPKYNSVRLHGSIANLTPYKFWILWENKLIERTVLKRKKVKFKLKIPYQKLSGKLNLKEVPCLFFDGLNIYQKAHKKVDELVTPQKQLSVQKSPSVVPC
tara:strand:+ start:510 stop:1478 length:969 start_codon:yes stop_codon:yes gene_type:complete